MKNSKTNGLKSFQLDTEFFNSPEMIMMQGRYGIAGPMCAMLLMCEVYREGYYCRMNMLKMFTVMRGLPGVDEQLMSNMIRDLIELGFFDKESYEKNQILTSAKIQEAYFKRRRPKEGVEYEFLLITLEKRGVGRPSSKKQTEPAHPTLNEVIREMTSDSLSWAEGTEADARAFYNYYNDHGWRNNDGHTIDCLPEAIIDWLSQHPRQSA